MASIAPSERLRRELHDLVAGVGEEDDPIEAIGRLGARREQRRAGLLPRLTDRVTTGNSLQIPSLSLHEKIGGHEISSSKNS